LKLKKRYTFLYMPEGNGASREFFLPAWLLVAGGVVSAFLLIVLVLYGVGLYTGSSWLPTESELEYENKILRANLEQLNGKVIELRAELDNTLAVQNLVASAVNLSPLDDDAYAAGVGGRGALLAANTEVPGLASYRQELAAGGGLSLDAELDLMLRQVRIQRQGFRAMLDTMQSREVIRDHIPSVRPVGIGWLSSRFGFRTDPFTKKKKYHKGLDFSVPTGTPVMATGDGVVAAVQQQRGFGRVIRVDHGNGVMTLYAHLDKAVVKKGARVQRGDVIAHSGNTGRSSAPHLHYEVRLSGRSVNPISYILDSPGSN
jgi:murein DD-endopeptidase MepM/ murein hydrolase activator NlpD